MLIMMVHIAKTIILLTVAGISEDLLVEAHGSFHTASCIGCGLNRDGNIVKKEIMSGKVPRCDSCKVCS